MAEPPAPLGLMIGRFQPMHWGHVELIRWIRSDGAVPALGIGSSQFSHTSENPFTAQERRAMVEAADRALGLRVARVFDVPDIFDDDRWVPHVEGCCGRFDVVYSNNEWTAGLFSKAGYEVRATPEFDRTRFQASLIREAIYKEGLAAVTDLVPEPVMEELRKFDAEKRIRTAWNTPTPARR